MKVVKRILTVGKNGKVVIEVPEQVGKKAQVILLPVESPASECGEWTDEEWEAFSLRSIAESKDDKAVDWAEHFGIKNR